MIVGVELANLTQILLLLLPSGILLFIFLSQGGPLLFVHN